MYVRNYMNKIVKIDPDAFSSEKQFYIALWKIKYNITIDVKKINTNDQLKKFINGNINFI